MIIGRIFILLLSATAAWAQLPPAQAAPPRSDAEEQHEKRKKEPEVSRHVAARLDAVVSDAKGEPVPGLAAQDFALTVDGKPQKIDTCVYRKGEPLRLVVFLDDLSLSAENSNTARRELRAFVERLGAKDEVAILRASGGSGALDRLTSDKRALNSAIDRAAYNPESENAPPETLAGTFRVPVRGMLSGLKAFPGRNAILFVSERLRDTARNAQISTMWLSSTAHLASTAVYAVDMSGAPNLTQLDLGFAKAAPDTGGVYYDGNRVAEALSRIARDAAGYYFFTYRAEGAGYDYITGIPRVTRVQLTTPGRDSIVRARNGVFGPGEDDTEYEEPDVGLSHTIGTELTAGALRANVTALASVDRAWTVNAIVHVNGSDLTFLRGVDSRYRATVEVTVALTSDSGATAEERVSRSLDATLTEKGLELARAYGIDYTATMPLSKPGAYHVSAAARDTASGRAGTARTTVSADWGPGKLSLSSLVLHGETPKDGVEEQTLATMEESSSMRRYRGGRKITYAYDLLNLAEDAEKRASIEVRARIWRGGALVMEGAPIAVHFEKPAVAGRRGATGTLALMPQAAPGRYVLGVSVTDKVSGRAATRFMDFEVRP